MEPVFQHTSLPRPLLDRIATRDVALWVDQVPDEVRNSPENLAFLARFVGLPWRMVLIEETMSGLAGLIDTLPDGRQLQAARGHIHVIASDPQSEPLPERCLPVYFLNGREDRPGGESNSASSNVRTRRRLNMIERLRTESAPVLVVLTWGKGKAVSSINLLWEEEGYRTNIAAINATARGTVHELQVEHELILASLDDLRHQVDTQILPRVPEGGIQIRVAGPRKTQRVVDITSAELVETPVRDTFEILTASELVSLTPEQLSKDELYEFFRRASTSWRPFAARVPWKRSSRAERLLIRALQDQVGGASRDASAFYILSEKGAGGTTLARQLAFSAAFEGYPTMVARPASFRPSSGVIKNFIQAANHLILDAAAQPTDVETAAAPWLIVFDVHHWAGHEGELQNFLREVGKSGSSVIVLLVVAPPLSSQVENLDRVQCLEKISHRISKEDALDFGRHLNVYLRPHGRSRSDDEWLSFWRTHSVGPETGNASFWISLEFWLKLQFDIGESIQSWLYKQFRDAQIGIEVKRIILDVAALSVAREATPESLISGPSLRTHGAIVLERVAATVPALTLGREWVGTERQWSLSHDILGRYLLTALSYDRRELAKLGLGNAQDALHLRFLILVSILGRLNMSFDSHRRLAIEFATRIMKLESGAGGAEFTLIWPDVLRALTGEVPRTLLLTSRIYLHHVAISCRRVATQSSEFETTLIQRKELLTYAVQYLERALKIPRRPDDETDLNLYNSLSLAYQDLAVVEGSAGASYERLRHLREEATKAARHAQEVDNLNSFVLETLARNLLQNAEFDPPAAAGYASEALYYVYQAMQLEASAVRQGALMTLADRSLQMLRAPKGQSRIDVLVKAGNPFGYLASAWLILAPHTDEEWAWDFKTTDRTRLDDALAVLSKARASGNLLILKLQYDIITALSADDHLKQLEILDDLIGTYSGRVPIQIRHERAILLHLVGRHPEARSEFQWLRRELKNTSAFVRIPERLKWLRAKDGTKRRCSARVVEVGDYRAMARVAELADEVIPLRPEEFAAAPRPGQVLYAFVMFAPMGPFLKPTAVD